MPVPNTRYLVLKPNPNLGPWEIPSTTSTKPFSNFFWTASEWKQNEIALIQIKVFHHTICLCLGLNFNLFSFSKKKKKKKKKNLIFRLGSSYNLALIIKLQGPLMLINFFHSPFFFFFIYRYVSYIFREIILILLL